MLSAKHRNRDSSDALFSLHKSCTHIILSDQDGALSGLAHVTAPTKFPALYLNSDTKTSPTTAEK
jgi:hypothetical protein